MFHAKDGVFFERQNDGSVRLLVKTCGRDDALAMKDITLNKGTWCSIIASMSHNGEEHGGYYRADNFHTGAPIDPVTQPR